MKISVIITLKNDVLDPQGKIIHQTLDGMGFDDVNEVDKVNILKQTLKKLIKIKQNQKLKKCVKNFWQIL